MFETKPIPLAEQAIDCLAQCLYYNTNNGRNICPKPKLYLIGWFDQSTVSRALSSLVLQMCHCTHTYISSHSFFFYHHTLALLHDTMAGHLFRVLAVLYYRRRTNHTHTTYFYSWECYASFLFGFCFSQKFVWGPKEEEEKSERTEPDGEDPIRVKNKCFHQMMVMMIKSSPQSRGFTLGLHSLPFRWFWYETHELALTLTLTLNTRIGARVIHKASY